jgi:hypothetical protein
MEQTFIMIKPDGVQRGLVINPRCFSFSFSFFSVKIFGISFFSLRLDASLAVRFDVVCLVGSYDWEFLMQIGDIISRFEKKGFYLKGEAALKLG